jgi:hypothetical protein
MLRQISFESLAARVGDVLDLGGVDDDQNAIGALGLEEPIVD